MTLFKMHIVEKDRTAPLRYDVCIYCGNDVDAPFHLRNSENSEICDTWVGPCSCGAWHIQGEQWNKANEGNKYIEEFINKVSNPDYKFTTNDEKLLQFFL